MKLREPLWVCPSFSLIVKFPTVLSSAEALLAFEPVSFSSIIFSRSLFEYILVTADGFGLKESNSFFLLREPAMLLGTAPVAAAS